jgi:hypothetical protein
VSLAGVDGRERVFGAVRPLQPRSVARRKADVLLSARWSATDAVDDRVYKSA